MKIYTKQRLFEVMEKVNPDMKVNVPKFTILVGISGSGKSYWIKSNIDSNAIVVSPDGIRKELTGDISDQSRNKEVFPIAFKRAVDALNSGKSVIFDATNVVSNLRKNMLDYMRQNVTNDFKALAKIFDVDPKVAKERIRKGIESGHDRSNVPDEAVDRQYRNFLNDLGRIESDGYEIIN